MSVCLCVGGICILSTICVCTTNLLSCHLVVVVRLHTRHKGGYSTTSLGPRPLPTHCQTHRNHRKLKSQLNRRRNNWSTRTHRETMLRAIVQSHNHRWTRTSNTEIAVDCYTYKMTVLHSQSNTCIHSTTAYHPPHITQRVGMLQTTPQHPPAPP